MDNQIIASVIIPAYNRCDSLRRALKALMDQTLSPETFEVIVVVDGCTDGTSEMLKKVQAPYSLQVIEQPNQGLTRSRNNGATRARGKLLIFHDDDLEAAPCLVQAHVEAHEGSADRVVIGYSLPVIPDKTDWIHIEHRVWWANFFQHLRQPGYRFVFRDLAGCNFSISKGLFNQVGAFDPDISAFSHEDTELGIRLLKNSAQFIFAPKALGHHHVAIDLDRDLARKRQEGRAEIRIARRHPDLWPALLPSGREHSQSLMSRLMRQLAFARPERGDRIAALLRWTLNILEKIRWYGRWRRHLGGLGLYWYWRGAAEELGSEAALLELEEETRSHSGDFLEIEIDLKKGLANAKQRIDSKRPSAVQIYYGSRFIGSVPYHPGAERLRGEHLDAILANDYSWHYLKALALENVRDQTETHDLILDRFLAFYNIAETD